MTRRRRHQSDVNEAGQDSFLDTLTNMVAVLIILVIIVALRAKNAPVAMSIASPGQTSERAELDQNLAIEQNLRHSMLETAASLREVDSARDARRAERARLALVTASAERMIADRRGQLDAAARGAFDRADQITKAQTQLSDLQSQYELASRVEAAPIRVENHPTPLSAPVRGREVHLQLRSGRIAVLPWDEIIEELKSVFQRSLNRMQVESEVSGRTTPIGGFRISYTIRRHDVSMEVYERTGQSGSFVRLERFSLLPVSDQLGEPFDQAMAPGSELREALARVRPGRTTVTLWVYPDSFDPCRRLTKALYDAGYDVATRPLPVGELIGGSPNGSRSAAQ